MSVQSRHRRGPLEVRPRDRLLRDRRLLRLDRILGRHRHRQDRTLTRTAMLGADGNRDTKDRRRRL